MSANRRGFKGRPGKGPAGGPPPGFGGDPDAFKAGFQGLGRAVKKYLGYYPHLAPIIIICILTAAVVGAIPPLFMQKVITVIEDYVEGGDWAAAAPKIVRYVTILGSLYLTALVLSVLQTQIMAFMTQGYLDKLRKEMYGGMQKLPVKYFDTHKHGDIMSHYTNDIDTLRQLASQAFPMLLQALVTVLILFAEMVWFSVWMTLILILGVFAMSLVTKKVGAGSAKYFLRQQTAVAATEGYVQEMMNGQKVVKVFNHEEISTEEFNKLNDSLCDDSAKANTYANILGPIINNIGNILYVALALIGGILIILEVPNLSISRMAFDISILVPFLNMSKQFMANLNQVTMQMNAIVMAGAGAQRVFALIDEAPEVDDGYVTLVNVEYDENGEMHEVEKRTGKWAWKHPHQADGTITYEPLKGDVRMTEVDFAYEEGKDVLHDITLYAKPGQKVAFVGATGAGKTTITNLINRFYDIADGKIRYDGINVNKIKKGDLRKSLGLVLQETNLFTGSVMDNIRYGRLDATDEECREAAKLAGADDFIERLPDGYETMLKNNGANLSQGQRQLIAIARAAVADPPVMILDEATSSIDTHTESIVQKGMDKLMEGRTVFVIAHRLSTVMNSDVIMVLDHGRIIERGTHDQLIEEKGTYYQLYTGAFELE
ncbi:MAG: ABC transporter ATP-binding protein [Clostridiales bacterium]|nr:ABC transporter ATP-binding protein [Clostridiales bacterium]